VTKPLTPNQVRALPWPQTLLAGQPLETKDAYEVGKLIVKQLQGGQALEPQARREWSLRTVARTIGVGSTATLGRCVQVYWVCETLGITSKIGEIPPHLLITAARLPSKQQLTFINRGIKEGWTRNGAIEKANEQLGDEKPSGRKPAAAKVVAKVAKVAKASKKKVAKTAKAAPKAAPAPKASKASKKAAKKASKKKASKKK
jgi:hypothetical protein